MTDTAREAAERQLDAWLNTEGPDVKAWRDVFREAGLPEPTYRIFRSELAKYIAQSPRRRTGKEGGMMDTTNLDEFERAIKQLDYDLALHGEISIPVTTLINEIRGYRAHMASLNAAYNSGDGGYHP
jgi:hypothetical protein